MIWKPYVREDGALDVSCDTMRAGELFIGILGRVLDILARAWASGDRRASRSTGKGSFAALQPNSMGGDLFERRGLQ